jgi:hypothetical protein
MDEPERLPPGIGRERRFDVYVDGARGVYPRVPATIAGVRPESVQSIP